MEETNLSKLHLSVELNEEEEEWKNISQNLIQTLPKSIGWNGHPILLYEGIWYSEIVLKGLVYLQKYFQPHETDVILASLPRSGTHWLKALAFTIVNRSRYSLKNTPLLTYSIDHLVPYIELDLVLNHRFPDLDSFTQTRVFATHAPYASLPCSIKDSENKIVYICRNPLDQFISLWFFVGKIPTAMKAVAFEEAFESYCQGNHLVGPFWDQILGYWHASIERPEKVLFLKYEDLKRDNVVHIKKLATFLGFPLSEDEEKQGLIKEISKLCSFESMKNLEVNKTEDHAAGIANSAFFRKGETGDFHNYLSPDQIVKLEKLIQEKLGKFGLSFDFS